MKKALIVLTSHDELGDTGRKTGFHLAEMTRPYRIFKEAGYDIDIVSPQGGRPPIDPRSETQEDADNTTFLKDPEAMNRLNNTRTPDRVDADDYEIVYFAGGHGTMWDLPENQRLTEIVSHIYGRGGIVAAVCHGPAALVNARAPEGSSGSSSEVSYLVEGKEVSAYTDEEERKSGLDEVVPFLLQTKLEERGAIFVKSPLRQAKVAVSERLVTGQNPASAEGVARAVVEVAHKLRSVVA